MCAVPFDGLRKDMVTTKQLEQMQAQIKDAIPTGALPSIPRQSVQLALRSCTVSQICVFLKGACVLQALPSIQSPWLARVKPSRTSANARRPQSTWRRPWQAPKLRTSLARSGAGTTSWRCQLSRAQCIRIGCNICSLQRPLALLILLLIVARMHTPGVGCAVDCLPLHLLQHMKNPAKGSALQVVYDDTDRVWVMLHSGSRNIGNVTATHYDRLAKAQLRKRRAVSPGGLNFFHIESEEGQQYLQVCSSISQTQYIRAVLLKVWH